MGNKITIGTENANAVLICFRLRRCFRDLLPQFLARWPVVEFRRNLTH